MAQQVRVAVQTEVLVVLAALRVTELLAVRAVQVVRVDLLSLRQLQYPSTTSILFRGAQPVLAEQVVRGVLLVYAQVVVVAVAEMVPIQAVKFVLLALAVLVVTDTVLLVAVLLGDLLAIQMLALAVQVVAQALRAILGVLVLMPADQPLPQVVAVVQVVQQVLLVEQVQQVQQVLSEHIFRATQT
jgi:hypothetical protein